MNINRLRPPKDCDDPAGWLAGVIWDAIRDAKDAGLSADDAHALLAGITRRCEIDKDVAVSRLRAKATT